MDFINRMMQTGKIENKNWNNFNFSFEDLLNIISNAKSVSNLEKIIIN